MREKVIKTGKVLVLILLYIIFEKSTVERFRSERLNTLGKKALYEADLNKAAGLVKESVTLNSEEPAYLRNMAIVYMSATAAEGVSEGDKTLLRNYAFNYLETAYNKQPYNLVNIKSLIPLYYYAALKDLKEENATFDDEHKRKVISFFARVENLAPTDADLYLLLGKYSSNLDEALREKYLKKAKELKSDAI